MATIRMTIGGLGGPDQVFDIDQTTKVATPVSKPVVLPVIKESSPGSTEQM